MSNVEQLLKDQVSENQYVDIAGVHKLLGIKYSELHKILKKLRLDDYRVFYIQRRQKGTDHRVTLKILAPPGTSFDDVYKNRTNIVKFKL